MEAQLDRIREILPELTINGQVIRFPCKLSEIPGIKTEVRLTGYMIAGDNSCLGFSLNGVHIDGSLYIAGDIAGRTDLLDDKVVGIAVKSHDPAVRALEFAGVTADYTLGEVLTAFGKPVGNSNGVLTYYFDDSTPGVVYLFFDGNEKFERIIIDVNCS